MMLFLTRVFVSQDNRLARTAINTDFVVQIVPADDRKVANTRIVLDPSTGDGLHGPNLLYVVETVEEIEEMCTQKRSYAPRPPRKRKRS